MLVATWVLAIATVVLAVSGPVALIQWRSNRKRDSETRQRDRAEEFENHILAVAEDRVKNKYVPQSWIAGALLAVGIPSLLALNEWMERRNGKRLTATSPQAL
jgi:hypothetical protein